MKRTTNVVLWVVSILLAALFVMSSLTKLTSNAGIVARFEHWGYPAKFYLVVGVMELAGAALLLVRRISAYGAGLLAVVMVGACVTHLAHGELPRAAFTATLLVALGIVGFQRYRQAKPTTEVNA